jgi:hypothetical protein
VCSCHRSKLLVVSILGPLLAFRAAGARVDERSHARQSRQEARPSEEVLMLAVAAAVPDRVL